MDYSSACVFTYPVCVMLYVREKMKTSKQKKLGVVAHACNDCSASDWGTEACRSQESHSLATQKFKASPDYMGHILLIYELTEKDSLFPNSKFEFSSEFTQSVQ